jgi:hypothetical protein
MLWKRDGGLRLRLNPPYGLQASNADTIASVAGFFAGAGGSFELFSSSGVNNEPVGGISITEGAQARAAITAGVTNTVLTPSLNLPGVLFAPTAAQVPQK